MQNRSEFAMSLLHHFDTGFLCFLSSVFPFCKLNPTPQQSLMFPSALVQKVAEALSFRPFFMQWNQFPAFLCTLLLWSCRAFSKTQHHLQSVQGSLPFLPYISALCMSCLFPGLQQGSIEKWGLIPG